MLNKVSAECGKIADDAILNSVSVQDDDRLTVNRKYLKEVCKVLKEHPDFDFKLLVDLTCVDYVEDQERFEVIYQLCSLSQNTRLRLKVRVPDGESLVSVSDVWGVANPLEREVYDMFGVTFEGHPNLKRILMYEGFKGHPLRKDYPLKKHQPIVPLLRPIETDDDPPYTRSAFDKKMGKKSFSNP